MNQVIEKEKIENMIYEIRGQQVMLDSDLAKLYGCKNGTKMINQAVNRNIERFPEDFYFQLTKQEYDNLKSQNVTSSWKYYGGVRKLPYAFTEQGVAMLSSVLKTSIASKVSVDIMRAFILMRKYISNNLIEQQYINKLVLEHDNDIKITTNKFIASSLRTFLSFLKTPFCTGIGQCCSSIYQFITTSIIFKLNYKVNKDGYIQSK